MARACTASTAGIYFYMTGDLDVFAPMTAVRDKFERTAVEEDLWMLLCSQFIMLESDLFYLCLLFCQDVECTTFPGMKFLSYALLQ